ncbi:MAG TPA: VWA domain-containing protein [Bryobacteraceae bacterium]|nr:VWA domain-containing protein [Bryobacteraceae bacterium]
MARPILKALLLAAVLLTGFLAAQQPPLFPSTVGPVKVDSPPPPSSQAPAQPGQTQPGQVQPGSDVIFRSNVRAVIAPVTVTDRDGRVVNSLTTLDFQLYDNKKLQKITEDQATHPISLVVAIEASAEVEKIVPQVQKIGPLLSNLLIGDSGEIAVLSFDHRVQTLTGFTSDPDQINAAMKKLKPGSTSFRLNDAAMQAMNLLRNRPPTRKRILLLITESRDNGSELHVRDVLTAAEFANVVVYSVDMSHLVASLTSTAQPPRPDAIPPEARHLPAGQIGTQTTDAQNTMGDWTPALKEIFIAAKAIFIPNPLEVYTKYTGGREYSFMTQKTLERAVADIGEELHSQYLLTYSPNNQDEAGFHEIEVRILKPGLKVRTRNGYWLARVNEQQ